MEPDEYFDDGARHARIHGEVAGSLTFGVGVSPVGGGAEPAHLARDGCAGLLLPRPHALDEPLPPEILPFHALRLELTLDHDLSGDPGVIRADDPVGVEPAHPVVADQGVHQRLLERVPHVQSARHVGRRQLDAECRAARVERLAAK